MKRRKKIERITKERMGWLTKNEGRGIKREKRGKVNRGRGKERERYDYEERNS